jgi:hypothetical protein
MFRTIYIYISNDTVLYLAWDTYVKSGGSFERVSEELIYILKTYSNIFIYPTNSSVDPIHLNDDDDRQTAETGPSKTFHNFDDTVVRATNCL